MTTIASAEHKLAHRLQQVYERERAIFEATSGRRQGSRRTSRLRHVNETGGPTDFWIRLARFCVNRSLDPQAYIQWHFERARLGAPASANRLLDNRQAQAFLESIKTSRHEITIALREQHSLARTHILLAQRQSRRSAPDAWASVLLDEQLPLSALFRFCLASSIGGERFLGIARIYAPEAHRQYLRHRADYDAVWHSWIPASLRNLTDEPYVTPNRSGGNR